MMRLVNDAMKEMDELRSAEAQRMDQTRKEYEAEVRGLKNQVARLLVKFPSVKVSAAACMWGH
jgi:hypothetical protein